MKKFAALLLPALFLLALTSCKKDGNNVTQNIDVTLVKNESYSFTFPDEANQNLEIEKQGTHYSVSSLDSDKTFHYTPASDYTGNDEVVISRSSSGHCPMSSGNEDKTVYNFRITVNLTR